ncbi:hypothetical protein MMC25_007076 [Agyrium rufum]|nr:hypothetical protein [Agyrium rufum]
MEAVSLGLGRHVQAILAAYPEDVAAFLQIWFGGELAYTLSIAFLKFSILAFYWRLFAVSSMPIALTIVAVIVVAWTVAVFLTTTVSCIPITAIWDLTVQGTCINLERFYLGITIPNVLTDIALFCLPLPYIWRLQVPKPQKVMLLGVFALGGLICVVSVLRLIYVIFLHTNDLTWNAVNFLIWTGMELYCAVICACLPSLRPLLPLLRGQPVVKANQTCQQNLKRSINVNPQHRWSTVRADRYSKTIEQSKGGSISPHQLRDSTLYVRASWLEMTTTSATDVPTVAADAFVEARRPEDAYFFSSKLGKFGRSSRSGGGCGDIKVQTDVSWDSGRSNTPSEMESCEEKQ